MGPRYGIVVSDNDLALVDEVLFVPKKLFLLIWDQEGRRRATFWGTDPGWIGGGCTPRTLLQHRVVGTDLTSSFGDFPDASVHQQ